jgi:iron complex transport system ATP-binding protein
MLAIRSLSVKFGDFTALQGVSLDVQPGEILAVIGPNGAGKSTLIRAASGVTPAASGSIQISGQEMNRLSIAERARFIAVVPQARSLPPAFSVFQAILLGRTPYLGWLGHFGVRDQELANKAMQRVELAHLADHRVGDLSGGEQQRVLLGRALTQEAPVMLLDEPTTHLDLHYQAVFLALIRKLVIENHLCVLMAVHDLNLAGLYADRVALLVEGRIQVSGTPEEVLTEENLTRVYDIPVQVIPHPEYGTPLVLPDGHLSSRKGEK